MNSFKVSTIKRRERKKENLAEQFPLGIKTSGHVGSRLLSPEAMLVADKSSRRAASIKHDLTANNKAPRGVSDSRANLHHVGVR